LTVGRPVVDLLGHIESQSLRAEEDGKLMARLQFKGSIGIIAACKRHREHWN
jgi:hypothetical protein